jgi:hypothetical protein
MEIYENITEEGGTKGGLVVAGGRIIVGTLRESPDHLPGQRAGGGDL